MLLSELHSTYVDDSRFIPKLPTVVGNRAAVMQDPNRPEPLGTQTGDSSELGMRSGNQYAMPANRGDGKFFQHGPQDAEGIASRRPVKVSSVEGEPSDEFQGDFDDDEEPEDDLAGILQGIIQKMQTTNTDNQFFN